MDYNARFYSPALGRFTQPDSVIPWPNNPQSWNRFSIGYNNPILYNDPSGHTPIEFAKDLVEGIGYQFIKTVSDSVPIPKPAILERGYSNINKSSSDAFQIGRVIGAVGAAAVGIAGIVGGAGGVAGGAVVCGTGVLCFAVVAEIALAAAVSVEGAIIVGSAVVDIYEIASSNNGGDQSNISKQGEEGETQDENDLVLEDLKNNSEPHNEDKLNYDVKESYSQSAAETFYNNVDRTTIIRQKKGVYTGKFLHGNHTYTYRSAEHGSSSGYPTLNIKTRNNFYTFKWNTKNK